MQTIAVIFGGRSAEHDISIITALSSVIKPLELTKRYNVEAIYIAKDGSWHWDEKLKDIKLFTSGNITDFVQKSHSASVEFNGGMTITKPGGLGGRKTVRIDIVFPAMHGTYGEDGSLMGLLEMTGIPYVGCSLSASVTAMDKILSKQIAESNQIPVAEYRYVQRERFLNHADTVIDSLEKGLRYPLFVKPAHLGSSIGISRVTDRQGLQNGLEVAVHYDERVIIEEEVLNLIEVTLPIMGNTEPKVALLERPLTKPEDFFDFDAKYISMGGKKGGKKGGEGYSELPAKLEKSLYKKAEQTALNVYKALGCSGIARVDMLIDSKTKTVYFNEINPMPGDLYAHNWRASGISSVELMANLVDYALERHAQRQKTETVFATNYLQQF